ncbi:Rnf-Nqr domain containing protein [Pseudomonas urmiensis]|uniref:Rnf-Nqr domain containing protein n=1 Tax=Pseudomonas urmiensis TaxID=2745493 RepID=UPI003D108F74
MSDYVLVLVSAALINHLFLHKGAASRLQVHAFGLSSAVLILLGLLGAKLLESLIFTPLQIQNLELLALLPLLASIAWGWPTLLARLRPAWPIAEMRPALLVNVTALGLALQLSAERSDWVTTLGWGLTGGLGFWQALALFDDLRQRCQHEDVPVTLRGLPIELLAAGVMAMAFSGLNGLFTT